MVSAWVDELNVCLGQVATDEKSNEITAVPKLLELLDIKGTVITLDALNCQQKTVEQIINQKADYVITVKNNQQKLHQSIASAFIEFEENGCRDRNFRSKKKERRFQRPPHRDDGDGGTRSIKREGIGQMEGGQIDRSSFSSP